ncbi:MAG: T9SS type A sorting domain-containing protein [Ignavibacteriaceae bacterium]
MKNILLPIILIVIFIVLFINRAEAQWTQTNGPYGGVINALSISTNAEGESSIFAGSNFGNGIFRSTNNGASWTQVNTYLAAHSFIASGTNIFEGNNGGGVYLSTDNGASWAPVNSGLTCMDVWSFAVSGSNLFAGTSGGGVFLSTNNGTNWTPVNTGITKPLDWPGIWVTSFAVSGTNLFAGTYENGLFLSTDNGNNWKPINSGLTDKYIWSLAVTGSNIFAGTHSGIFLSTNNGTSWTQVRYTGSCVYSLAVSGTNIFAAVYGSGVFLSSDNGNSWSSVNSGLTNLLAYSLAVSGKNLFVGTYEGDGVFLSTNNGTSWTVVNSGLTNLKVTSIISNGDNLYACTIGGGVFLSTDNGMTWPKIDSGLSSPYSNWVYALTFKGEDIFAGTMDGIYRSSNNNVNWTPANNGLTNPFVSSLIASGDYLFAGTEDGGIFLSQNNGANWALASSDFLNTIVWSFVYQGENLFAATNDDGIYLSTNNGTSWSSVNSGLNNLYIPSLAYNGGYLFAGTGNGVFRSSDNGKNWAQSGSFSASSFAVYGNNLFAGGNGVLLSTNNGLSWTSFDSDLTNPYVTSLVVSGINLFAGVSGRGVLKKSLKELTNLNWLAAINVKDNGNILQTISFGQLSTASDGIDLALGESPLPPPAFGFDVRFHLPTGDDSWKDYRASNLDTAEWLIKFQPGSGGYPMTFSWDTTNLPKGSLYLKDIITGSIVNVNMKTDSSYTLTNSGINELKIDYTGLANSPTAIKDVKDLPTVFSLSQNYPNPFNPSTVIKYGLPGISNVKINIYNLLGQVVESLVNGIQNAGYHEVTWNASNKASGVYLYSIEAMSADGKGDFRSVKKLILLK